MKNLRIAVIIVTAALISPLNANNLNSGFIAGFTGGYLSPAGFYSNTFNPGMGFGATLLYYPGWGSFFLEGNASFAYFSIQASPNSTMSQYNITAGPGFTFSLTRWFEPFISLQGGASYVRVDFEQSGLTSSSTKPLGIATAGVMISPFEYISLRLAASYGVSELSDKMLYTAQFSGSAMMRLNVFTGRNILDRNESFLRLSKISLKPIFGARYMSYGVDGIGVVTVTNASKETLRDVRVDTAINEINSGPTKSQSVKTLAPGQSVELDLPIMIDRAILKMADSRELPVKLRAYYTVAKGTFSYIETKNATVHSRNTITWDNTAHIGNFITPYEDIAFGFARNALSLFKQKMLPGFNKKVQEALILFDTLGAAGISYAADPNTGFEKLGAESLDYVMFARETLHKKAGDCDDLTVLYSTMLESIGIKTAVITTPGHIFLMFDTEVPDNSYTDITSDPSLIHAMNGTAWVPIEVTMVGKSFIEAWKEGARSVNRYKGIKGSFETLEVKTAWAKFPPADIGSGRSVPVPDREKTNLLYALDMDQLKTTGFEEQARKLQIELDSDQNNYQALISLGVLNAKFGKIEEAFSFLKKAANKFPNRPPAYVNIGNIYMLKKNYELASQMFEKASSLNPDNHKYRINLARAYYEVGKRYKAKVEYREALKANPGYARRYDYLDSDPGVRAADPEERAGYNMWEK